MGIHHVEASWDYPLAALHEVPEESNHELRHRPHFDMGFDRRKGFQRARAAGLLRGLRSDKDYMLAQLNSFVHNRAEDSRAQGSSTHGHHAQAWCERRLRGPAAASPRRTPRFRALWAAAEALVLSGEDDAELLVRGQFDAETIDGVEVAGVVPVPALRQWDGVGSKYEVVKQNPTGEYRPRICDSSCYPLPPSPSTRLFRGCRRPRSGNGLALRCSRYHWNSLRQ